MDLKTKVTWYNRCYNYEKMLCSNADDEELLEYVNGYYLCQFDETEFEYTDVWNLVRNKPFFM